MAIKFIADKAFAPSSWFSPLLSKGGWFDSEFTDAASSPTLAPQWRPTFQMVYARIFSRVG